MNKPHSFDDCECLAFSFDIGPHHEHDCAWYSSTPGPRCESKDDVLNYREQRRRLALENHPR